MRNKKTVIKIATILVLFTTSVVTGIISWSQTSKVTGDKTVSTNLVSNTQKLESDLKSRRNVIKDEKAC